MVFLWAWLENVLAPLKNFFSIFPYQSTLTPIFSPLEFVWLEVWKIEKIENREEIEKWEDRKNLVFSHMYLIGKIEKWENEKLIYLVEKKNEKMKIEISINLQLYPY